MSPEPRSILEGTIGLDVVLVAALLTSLSRPLAVRSKVIVANPALVTLALQALHFTEEYLTRFPVRFPKLLGLLPWSGDFFVAFNAAWIATWALAIAFVSVAPRTACAPLWFLAFAAIANGIAHPVASLAVGGYFPGLITAIPLGISGFWLAGRLSRASV
jgi:hypothetical protein